MAWTISKAGAASIDFICQSGDEKVAISSDFSRMAPAIEMIDMSSMAAKMVSCQAIYLANCVMIWLCNVLFTDHYYRI